MTKSHTKKAKTYILNNCGVRYAGAPNGLSSGTGLTGNGESAFNIRPEPAIHLKIHQQETTHEAKTDI